MFQLSWAVRTVELSALWEVVTYFAKHLTMKGRGERVNGEREREG